MKTKFKRIISCLLVVIIVLTIAPLGGFVGLKLGLSARAADYNWPLPTQYSINCGWQAYSGHSGVDMASPQGTPVYAVCDGTVTYYQIYTTINGTRYLTSYGNAAYLESGSRLIIYGHLSGFVGAAPQITATKQQGGNSGKITLASKKVKAGETIGYVGQTGNATGNHLHFELRINGTAVNPTGYLSQSVSAADAAGSSSSTAFKYYIDAGIGDGTTFDISTTKTVDIRGWAFRYNGDDTTVYWCIDDIGKNACTKVERSDVVEKYGNKQLNCGFTASIPISNLSEGRHKFSLWCSVASGGSQDMSATYFNVTHSDNEAPKISNVAISNRSNGYLVTCSISDNEGVTRVRFPSWTDANAQDDIVWHEGTINNDGKTAYCWIDIADHKNETGWYITHIYAYDAKGNASSYAIPDRIYVGNLIQYWDITNADNSSLGINTSGTPTISGTKKFWFIEYDIDTNYYIDILLDGKTVVSHGKSDSNGYVSYTVSTGNLSNGTHTITADLYDTNAKYTVSKSFIVSNPQYTVTFNANQGSCSVANKTVTLSGKYGTLPTPTRDGYTFNGWYTSATGGTKITADSTVSTQGNHTLYAHWTCNHKYTGVVTKEATCTTNGVKTFTCSTCKNSYTEAIQATGHKESNVSGKPATCTENGLTDGKKCSVCNEILQKQQTISATGHKDNNNDGKCDICNEILIENPSENCSHICHKTGIMKFFYQIARFFWKIFGTNKYCECGVAHY